MTRNAIVFTANTLHVAQANLMIDSLFDPGKGNFFGDLWVISTHLSSQCQEFLESRGIRFLVNPLLSLQQWEYRKDIARSQPEYRNGRLSEEDAFLLYRNKRMSKLITCDWVKKFGARYDGVALCDNDLYFQRDVNELFAETVQVNPNVLWYWQEENKILPGSDLWIKNLHYARLHNTDGIDFGAHEINIGFVISSPNLLYDIFYRVKNNFLNCKIELFRDHKWHDQDLVRLIRGQDPKMFQLFEEGNVLHLCNGGEKLVDEVNPQEFYHKKTGEKPRIIHFAGGAWRPFDSIASSYTVDHSDYFFMEEQSERFDKIRAMADYDLFDSQSSYFSAHNIATNSAARERWVKLAAKSDKKRILFFSWLVTGSHRSTYNMLRDFLSGGPFDLAIIDGNVTVQDYEELCIEDLPDLLARVTQTVRDDKFGRAFGYTRKDVPEDAIDGSIAALIKEYGCSRRNARAVANAAYIYLSNAVSFYRPDVIVGWGRYQINTRILKRICEDRGIPFLSLELGVLPETMAIDCLGHMGESWVAQNAKNFNMLPLDASDREAASVYLKHIRHEKPSRNIALETQPSVLDRINAIKSSGRKVVVYIGSNCAGSGHVPYDDTAQLYHSPYFVDNDDVVRCLSETFATDPSIHVVYKPHPISITRGLDLSDEYEGVTVLNSANLDECLSIADLALVKVSQSNYEAILRNVPVLMLGKNQLNGSGAVYELSSRDALKAEILKALENGLTADQKHAFEDHVARLLRYYLYSVEGRSYGRPQSQVLTDLHDLLESKGQPYLDPERTALAAFKKPALQSNPSSPTLSVIMPVYNGARYLAECIGSVLSQTFEDFELICVNNGSTDESQETLEYFARMDDRVKVLTLPDPNQCAARNLGVNSAKGAYLHFVDCDDLLVPTAYEELFSAIDKTNPDVLYFFFSEMHSTFRTTRPRHRDFQNYLPNSELFSMDEEHKYLFAQYPFPVVKIFNASFFRANDLYFDVNCNNYEDNPQNLRTLLSSKKIQVLNKSLYKYRRYPNSLSQSINPRAGGMTQVVRLMNEIYSDSGRYSEFQKYYVPYKVHLLHFAWTRLPDEQKDRYMRELPDLFLAGDTDYFESDELVSMFPYFTPQKVEFIRSSLRGEPSKQNLWWPAKKPRTEFGSSDHRDESSGTKKLHKRIVNRFKGKPSRVGRFARKITRSLKRKYGKRATKARRAN